jgi:ABC-type amino acid transport substrate-binding protein
VGHVLKVKGWPSLQLYRLVTVRGVKEIEQLGVEYRVEYVNASEQAFKMIDAGRADLAIFSRGAQCMPVLLGLKRIQIQEPAIQKFHFYHHVHRRHQAWIPKIEAELSRMQKDGSWLRIQDETRKRWVRCP